ncbi:class I SAM-dependent methyltransferase [Streptacidiphilus rugosus]|uniref:class I SAM-dependent methyltransferase n=1 Tax=Streptacidiphilus rugosus TaxID=405783 RepID=UPI000568C9DB|nr:class I SAM-dependent methyltransferase [Streptacidiphilus rugosus]
MDSDFTADDEAALYDLLNPWEPTEDPSARFYTDLVMAAGSALDVGCGTGQLLHLARSRGHQGRLAGIDPDAASLRRARARESRVEWVDGTAADAHPRWAAEFELATMSSCAFQCLVTDEEVRSSLAAVCGALRPGGRFVFETRHPGARAWESWTSTGADDVTDARGRRLYVSNGVEAVTDDQAGGWLVTCTETTAGADGAVLHLGRATLRFFTPEALDAFLTEAGFVVEARHGDFDGGAFTSASRGIVTVARRV